MTLRCLDLDRFRATPLTKEPFEFVVVPRFIRADAQAKVDADYPDISYSGSFPLGQVSYGPGFRDLVDELESDEFRGAIEEKFALDLSGRPTTITVRGRCGAKDGQIHTDSTSKIITILIYMNSSWEAPGGRLRLLRAADNLDDVIAEIPPTAGTLLAFKRADNSWHGHKQFVGERRVVQFNWVTSELAGRIRGHQISALFKRVVGALRPKHARV